MAEVLVDTSVWVEFLRRSLDPPWRPVLIDLLDRDQVVIVEPTISELLHGIRGERERGVILDLAAGVRRARIDLDTWIATGDLGRTWRSRGRTLSLVDCLLATVAQRDDLPLWSLDEDFTPLVAAGLRRFAP